MQAVSPTHRYRVAAGSANRALRPLIERRMLRSIGTLEREPTRPAGAGSPCRCSNDQRSRSCGTSGARSRTLSSCGEPGSCAAPCIEPEQNDPCVAEAIAAATATGASERSRAATQHRRSWAIQVPRAVIARELVRLGDDQLGVQSSSEGCRDASVRRWLC